MPDTIIMCLHMYYIFKETTWYLIWGLDYLLLPHEAVILDANADSQIYRIETTRLSDV